MPPTVTPAPADFTVENHFTIYMLTPRTPAAQQWADANLLGDVTVFGGSIAVEHRYISDIVEGIRDYGLTVALHGKGN